MKLNVDDLVEQGLVKKKTYTEGRYAGLSVLKYTKRVFWDNLWHLDDRLLECRGTIVDEDDNVVVLPFKKVFNLGENGTTVAPDRLVVVPEKINGFMAAATMTDKYGLIISTTGTLDSEYASLARKWIEKGEMLDELLMNATYLFEICDKNDPHIVEEEEGAYLIGLRHHHNGHLSGESALDCLALTCHNFKRPITGLLEFKDIPETKKEGYMVRCAETGETLCKLKSRHYLTKKFFSRVGTKKVNKIFSSEFRTLVEEEYYPLQEFIIGNYSKETWIGFSEQQRLNICEVFLKEAQ